MALCGKGGLISFFSALFFYALLSSPTPDSFGIVEGVVALFLILSVRLEISPVLPLRFALFGAGLVVPLVVGGIAGHSGVDILRDVIPYLFLFMPLFWGWIGRDEKGAFWFFPALACMGLLFSLRTILSYQDILLTPRLWGQGAPADLLYLANSPEVLFSALFVIGSGVVCMMTGRKAVGVLLLMLSLLPLLAMTLMMQRAGIGMVVLCGALGLLAVTWVRPKQAFFLLGGIALVFVLSFPFLIQIYDHLMQKTDIVGLNSRLQEWEAVLSVIFADWAHVLFGIGWGGRIENPAVGGLSVTYTHSLFSALLLKTGVLGSGVILAGVLTPVFDAVRHVFRDKNPYGFMVFIAILAPFLVSGLLYASYKSLGFGLILCAFSILSIRKLEKNYPFVS